MTALRELVASAVGFNEARGGDSVTLKTMEFEPIVAEGSEANAGLMSGLNIDVMSLIKLSVLALVTVVLGLFVLRPIFGANASAASSTAGALPGGPAPPVPSGLPATPGAPATGFPDPSAIPPDLPPPLTGEIDDGGFHPPEMAVVSDIDFDDGDLPALNGGDSADPVERLRALIDERQGEMVEVLRGWMEDEEEPVQ